MKRLNNKGITTIEVIISFVIVVIITASLYTTVSNYNQKRLIESYKSKIYTYKNTLTKEIQDDFIKIGLTHASYEKKHVGYNITHTVECDLRDGTKRKLEVIQRYTDSTYHTGEDSVDDFFMIKYGDEEAGDFMEYPLPNVGESLSEHGRVVYDLSINNVLINIEDDNILSIYIGFYHPELMTRYGINIVCPIDFVSKGVDTSAEFNVREATKATKRYTFHPNGGSGIINPITATIGQPFEIPGKGVITREGYTLKKWNTQPDGSGKDFAIGETVVPAANQTNGIVLYAQWEQVPTKTFDYTGTVSSYTVPADGLYQLEAWGAQGGAKSTDQTISSHAGLGGYTKAEAKLRKGDIIYIVVGGQGEYAKDNSSVGGSVGGYNGGGDSGPNLSGGSGSGGGATHIAKVSGLLKNLEASKNQIYIVAGGGGGADNGGTNGTGTSDDGSGGSGGGTSGAPAYINGVFATGEYFNAGTSNLSGCGMPGTQDKGFAFGQGEHVIAQTDTGGGGGGFYGGHTTANNNGGGAGGSGHLNKTLILTGKMYCFDCPTDVDTLRTTTYNAEAKSNQAKLGNGYAIIKYISD